MSLFKNDFVDHQTYNLLPHISQNQTVPEDHSRDLEDLRALLTKHEIRDISIRLVHKHFDAQSGEIFAFSQFHVPDHESVKLMMPCMPTDAGLRPVHYLVDEDGSLQAYEYAVTTSDLPDTTSPRHVAFASEFCEVVERRDLRRKFGLKLRVADLEPRGGKSTRTTEFELNRRRMTVTIPDGMPMPRLDSAGNFEVLTEWGLEPLRLPGGYCAHGPICWYHPVACHHGCSKRGTAPAAQEDAQDGKLEHLRLGGQKVEQGSVLHEIMTAILVAA